MELNPATIGAMREVKFSTRSPPSVRFGRHCPGLGVSQGCRALGVAQYTFRCRRFRPQGGDLGGQTRRQIRGLVGGSQTIAGHRGLHIQPVASLL